MTTTTIPSQLAGRVVDVGATTTAIAIDASLGKIFNVTCNGNGTVTITNPTDGQVICINFLQGAGGSHSVALGAQVAYSDSIASFTASTTAALVDSVCLQYYAAASKWIVLAVNQGAAV